MRAKLNRAPLPCFVFRSMKMNLRITAATLCLGVALVFGSVSDANAFGFGLCGNDCGCCDVEPTCGCEPSCGCEEISCCDPCADRGCCILDRLKGLFSRDNCGCCVEPSCGCEASCCVAEPTCGCEPSCGCEEISCCDPCASRSCCVLDRLKGLFNRGNSCGCCDIEPSCGCEPSCGVVAPSCGCN